MLPRILIIGDEGQTRFIAAAIASLNITATVQVVNTAERTPCDGLRFDATNSFTNLTEALKAAQEPDAYSLKDEVAAGMAGIQELRAWLENVVRAILSTRRPGARQHARPIFQPCWRAARWKSLT